MSEEKIDCGKYEFSAGENKVLATLSKDLHLLGLLMGVVGMLFVIYLIVAYWDPQALLPVSESRSVILNAVDYGLWIIIAGLIIYVSFTVVHLARPIRKIVETSGADMINLWHFLNDLTRMVGVCYYALIVVAVLMIMSLLLLIFVF